MSRSNSVSIAFVTLGCPKNEVDSDRMAAAVAGSAYRLVGDPDDADVVVLNTCAFIEPATEESIEEAFALAHEWRPARPGRRLIVAGCMVSRYGDDLAAAMPEPDAFVAVADEDTLLSVIERLTGRLAGRVPTGILRTPGAHTAYLKVTEGCDRNCAYCTIPAIRGRFMSIPQATVLQEAEYLVEHGARELVLVGQDIARYGHGAPVGPGTRPAAPDLASLVRALDALPGDFRMRLMYLQPDGVTPALLEAVATSRRVCHYFDIPLQHASAHILRAMGRPGDAATHRALLQRIRSTLPDVTLRTTVMAGFPGETEADAQVLEDFIAEAGFDYVGVFPYSAEEGTRAAEMPGQVAEPLRLERAQRIRDIADATGFARAAQRVDTTAQVLVEGTDEDGQLWGRTRSQAPEVDGITLLDAVSSPAGAFVTVRITDSVGYDLVGEPL